MNAQQKKNLIIIGGGVAMVVAVLFGGRKANAAETGTPSDSEILANVNESTGTESPNFFQALLDSAMSENRGVDTLSDSNSFAATDTQAPTGYKAPPAPVKLQEPVTRSATSGFGGVVARTAGRITQRMAQ